MYDLDQDTINKIKDHYQKGEGSIQDIARVYRIDVGQVLHIIGQDEMLTVVTQGDLVDESELQPGTQITPMHRFNVPFTTN